MKNYKKCKNKKFDFKVLLSYNKGVKKLLKARAGRKTRVHTTAGKTPAISFWKVEDA